MKKDIILSSLLLFTMGAYAQLKVGDNPSTINSNSLLELESTNKGILLPRVALTSTNSASPLSSFVAGMLVYNTATAGTAPNNVIPGTYISNGTAWIRVANAADASKWTNNSTNTRVELSTLSDGTTTRSAGASVAITDAGNVGLGTTSPNYKLSLGNNLDNTKLAVWDGSSTNAFGLGAQTGQFRFHTNSSTDRFSFLNAPNGTELVTMLGTGSVGIGNSNPNTSAKLDVTSTTQGFLPPRMTNAQASAISSPAAGLMVWCTDCGSNGELIVYNGNSWKNMLGAAICPTSVTFTYNGSSVTYGTVSKAYGGTVGTKCWLDRNLGATQVATSFSDANALGHYFQWGRGADGHQISSSGTTTTLSSTDNPGNSNFITSSSLPYDWRNGQNANLWQGVNGINNPCPRGFRIPTETELNAERASWSSQNASGAFNSVLRFTGPVARIFNSGSLNGTLGDEGYYWSSTVSGTLSRSLYIHTSSASIGTEERGWGYSVRCIQD